MFQVQGVHPAEGKPRGWEGTGHHLFRWVSLSPAVESGRWWPQAHSHWALGRASSPFLSFLPMVTGSVPRLGPVSGCQESSREVNGRKGAETTLLGLEADFF